MMELPIDLPKARIDAPRYLIDPWLVEAAPHSCEVLVVGGGAAGLAAALRAAEQADVTLLARGELRESNSAWAQGGIAAALNGGDSPSFHIADTLVAGAGLCDLAAVEALAYAAPALMHELAGLGVPFEQHHGSPVGSEQPFALGLEGGHSQRRILHVGDATGWAITSALIGQALRHPRIRVLEGFQAVDMLADSGSRRCTGVLALDAAGGWHRFRAGAVVLATGGAGALYGLTSNQPFALGEGIAMAYRAGAEVVDMEFVQFHPTVYRTSSGSGFLITEAARGEGGVLRTPGGRRFMPEMDRRAELAPRDVVTRGIYAAMRHEGAEQVLLDLTALGRAFLEERFPTIVARCRADGLDPAAEPIPVAPAAHYLMGGIRTDLSGATSLPGLYAAGECACTGVHGANRLASNSLLECLVFGRRAGSTALQTSAERRAPVSDDDTATETNGRRRATDSHPELVPQPATCNPKSGWRAELAATMRACAGPLRHGDALAEGLRRLDDRTVCAAGDPESVSAANALLAARLIVGGALLRRESRGAHFRSDCPESGEAWRGHLVQQRGVAPHLALTVADRERAVEQVAEY
jgi:L-aspartate oxidase